MYENLYFEIVFIQYYGFIFSGGKLSSAVGRVPGVREFIFTIDIITTLTSGSQLFLFSLQNCPTVVLYMLAVLFETTQRVVLRH